MQIFPSSLRDVWTTWELPVMVIFSLFLQAVLIPMGYKRKYSSKKSLQWLLWLAYLSADSVATISLGILSSGGGGCHGGDSLEPRYVIRAFWAPFFLLHLGGPDSITAYSMQDNDLWLRHLLGLLIQAAFTAYIFLLSLQPIALNFVAIPVFVAGILKYGERTWVLRSASTQNLRNQKVPHLSVNLSITIHVFKFPLRIYVPEQSPLFNDLRLLHIARSFFEKNKFVFADLILSTNDLKQALYYFLNFDYKSAFKVVELELGFLHDLLYTKAPAIHSRRGALLRVASLSFIVAAIISFCTCNTHRYSPADVYLTFILIFGALGVEIYSIFLILCSDWCVIWLTQINSFLARTTLKAIYGFGWSVGKKRWSNSVQQYSLITRCFEDINGRDNKKFLKMSTAASRPIPDELKNRIFEQLKEMLELESEARIRELKLKPKLAHWILKKRRFYNHLEWSRELNYSQSILVWHIATELCYYCDHKNAGLKDYSLLGDTKLLSDFMAYLLAYNHSLFSNGMGRTRFDATVADTKSFLLTQRLIKPLGTVDEAYERILEELDSKNVYPSDVAELGVRSVLRHGCWLAQKLRELEVNERWEMIVHEWVEMLVNISCECKLYDHIELVGHGGHLLTHVWLLAHHLGYTRQGYDVLSTEEGEIHEFHGIVRHLAAPRIA